MSLTIPLECLLNQVDVCIDLSDMDTRRNSPHLFIMKPKMWSDAFSSSSMSITPTGISVTIEQVHDDSEPHLRLYASMTSGVPCGSDASSTPETIAFRDQCGSSFGTYVPEPPAVPSGQDGTTFSDEIQMNGGQDCLSYFNPMFFDQVAMHDMPQDILSINDMTFEMNGESDNVSQSTSPSLSSSLPPSTPSDTIASPPFIADTIQNAGALDTNFGFSGPGGDDMSSCASPTPSSPRLQGSTSGKSKRRRCHFCPFPGCSRSLTSEYTLRVHMETHKPRLRETFPCTMGDGCTETFSRRHDRLRHEVIQHAKTWKWTCGKCSRPFSNEKMLNIHKCKAVGGLGRAPK